MRCPGRLVRVALRGRARCAGHQRAREHPAADASLRERGAALAPTLPGTSPPSASTRTPAGSPCARSRRRGQRRRAWSRPGAQRPPTPRRTGRLCAPCASCRPAPCPRPCPSGPTPSRTGSATARAVERQAAVPLPSPTSPRSAGRPLAAVGTQRRRQTAATENRNGRTRGTTGCSVLPGRPVNLQHNRRARHGSVLMRTEGHGPRVVALAGRGRPVVWSYTAAFSQVGRMRAFSGRHPATSGFPGRARTAGRRRWCVRTFRVRIP